jgi:hypothetical protein
MNVVIPNNNFVKVEGIKFNVTCRNNPSHKWGIYLNSDGSLPVGWNVCLKCSSKKFISECREEIVKETYERIGAD